ncbi:hypothetical protein [Arthrobacter sp. Y81]|uniref:YobI family P-loop NTPase n=1 Tax=Arthrobacter sp. Y81 TaxID=2058897 RepID=UPI000CE4CE36|nr:hypothetical protein [Arthrobacter sp. Y81]
MDDTASQTLPAGTEPSGQSDGAADDVTFRAAGYGDGRVGLLPLTAGYEEVHHGLYVRYLQEALTGSDRDTLRNIALTGGYGIGKSSILQEVSERADKGKVLTLSLSTLGDEPPTALAADGGQPVPVTKTNRIQKEIVKQLLYREDPARVPGSRYRRMGSFKWSRESMAAVICAATVVLLGYLTRFTDRLINFAGDNPLARVGMHVALFVLVAGLILAARWVFHNRFWIEKLIAGPATISLSNKSGSYFDEYLDEIVYFFGATHYDIAIFEDIDRFEDPHIFQTLRELNTILNNSKQLDRNIRFIYAIKDSIFEQLGSDDPTAPDVAGNASVTSKPADAAKAETERANRTKFFDLVIPVVPFITHRSARDHMTDILTKSGLDVSRELVALAARHIPDMRLIKNIHNEYGIFRERLLLSAEALPGLNADSLFAMIVYKNIHLSDFEQIKTGSGQLDKLYETSRALVDENVAELDKEATRIQVELVAGPDASASLADSLGEKLERYVFRVFRHQGLVSFRQISFSIASGSFTRAEIRTALFWKPYMEGGGQLSVSVRDTNNNPHALVFTLEDISEAFGKELSPEDWKQYDHDRLKARLKEIDASRRFLLSADMADLVASPEYTVKVSEEAQSLKTIRQDLLGSALAIDLVDKGFIDRNFTLYTSQFQGVHVSIDAMNFILHHVQPNRMGINFPFPTSTDIEAMLGEAGPNVLAERSMYNIEILDYLLAGEDIRCTPIIRNLAVPGQDEQDFTTAYLARGKQREALYRKLASFMPEIFSTIVDMAVDFELKTDLFNAALTGAQTDVDYSLHGLGPFIEDNYASMNLFTADPSHVQAIGPVMEILKELDVSLPTLLPLNAAFKRGIVENSLYHLTVTNLRAALDGHDDFALDAIKDRNATVYAYVLDNADQYVPLMSGRPEPSHTIHSPSRFIEILEDAAARDASAVAALAKHAAPGCIVADIQAINRTTWPSLAKENRLLPTFANLESYVRETGRIDEDLAVFLTAAGAVLEYENATEEAKETLAVLILNAGGVLPDQGTRVQLAESLALKEFVDVARIHAEPGQLIGLLIRDRIVNDTAESYGPAVGFDWPTREFAIHQSKQFSKYLEPEHVPSEDLGSLLTSAAVPAEVKNAVLNRLPEFGVAATPAALTEAASYALTTGIDLTKESLRTLAAGKADSIAIVTLLEPVLHDFGYTTVEEILKTMGPPYKSLTQPGTHHVKLPRTAAHLALARFVENFGYASSNNWDRTPGLSEMKVFMGKT